MTADGTSRRVQLLLKRVFDLIAASLALIVLSPVAAGVCGAVLLSMGTPVLFRQERLGRGGRRFVLRKFRTMTEERDAAGRLLPDAQRLTRVGKFLRSTTLDELPELVNVIMGNMSIVGPRPLPVCYRDRYSPEQWRRHEMPPGMAGPVLAGGRNALGWDEKFALDVWYVDHWSLWLDIQILAKTALQVLKREGISAAGFATMPEFMGSAASGHGAGGEST